MNSINDSRRLQRAAYLAATIIVALCCQAAGVSGAEPTSPKSTASTASAIKRPAAEWGTQRKLQWQPKRNGSTESNQPVRSARYEEDVFTDGPVPKAKTKLAAAESTVAQAEPKTPFDLPDPPKETTPPPTDTPPTDTVPAPTPLPEFNPTPGITPPPFGPPTTPPPTIPSPAPEPTPTPTPAPAPTPDPLREPFRAPEPDRRPGIFLEPPSSPLDSDLARINRPPTNPAQDCKEAYDVLKKNTIDKLSVKINVEGIPGDTLPFECTLTSDQFDPRCWRLTTYTWKASALCHKPIYFEEEHLERYGHSHGPGCEYLVSFAHFFGNVILLPYHMGVETPCECIYTLGVYRAGSCAPYMLDPFPISLRGAAFGAVGYCGVVALLP